MSRGAPKAPITYAGPYDPAKTYLPLQIATVITGGTRMGYLSTATSTGADPTTHPDLWLPLSSTPAAPVPLGPPEYIGWAQSLSLAANAMTSYAFSDADIAPTRARPSWATYAGGNITLAAGSYDVLVNVTSNAADAGVQISPFGSNTNQNYMPTDLLYVTPPKIAAGSWWGALGFYAGQVVAGQTVGFTLSAFTQTSAATINASIKIARRPY